MNKVILFNSNVFTNLVPFIALLLAISAGKKRICILSFQGQGKMLPVYPKRNKRTGSQPEYSLVEEGPRVPLKTCIIRLYRSMYRINLSAICQRWVVSSVLVKVCNEKAINESIYYVIPFKQLQLQ